MENKLPSDQSSMVNTPPVPEVAEADIVHSVDPTAKESVTSQSKFKPIYLILILLLLGLCAAALYIFSKKNADKQASLPQPSPAQIVTPSPTPEPSTSPDPSIAPVASPRVSPKPSVKPSPTPTVIVDNTFTCGSFSDSNYPNPPALGTTPLYVTMFPSGGTSGNISLAGFEWDFDGDGSWEGGVSSSKVGRTYDKNGTFKPKYRTKGANGAVGPTCTYPYDVVSNTTVAFQNDILSVDILNKDVTISKSRNNHTFTGSLAKLNNDPYEIYIPFFTVSTKKQPNAIILKDSQGGGYGASTGTSYMIEGTSWPTQIRVSKNMPNGVYTGNVKIQYTDSTGVTGYDAATANYKITVTD